MLHKLKITLYIRVGLLLTLCLLLIAANFLISKNNLEQKSPSSSADSTRYISGRHLMSVSDDRESNFSGTVGVHESLTEDDENFYYMRLLNFTQYEQVRKNGRLVMHVVLSCYCFWMLAIICDEYFIVSIHIFCQKLRIKHELASATFMTMATSAPELCISCVSTFITDGDISLGTIVGSAIFNILVVCGFCGIYARSTSKLNALLFSRDCMLYALSIIGLIAVIYDHLIMWYEALLMIVGYIIYLIIMYKNDAMVQKMRLVARKIKSEFWSISYIELDDEGGEVTEITPLFKRAKDGNNNNDDDDDNSCRKNNKKETKLSIQCDNFEHSECASNPWRISTPRDTLRWPITFILWCTIPDCRRFQKFYVLTFINCVAWILILSYVIASMIAIVDSIVGFLFLGAGTSIPEAVSSVIVSMQGNADIGISNAIASNIFDILFCLGVSWTARTLIAPLVSSRPWIPLSSTGITYSAISLLATLSIFYFLFAMQRFKLNRKISVSCLMVYLGFITYTILLELNLFAIPRVNFLSSNGLI